MWLSSGKGDLCEFLSEVARSIDEVGGELLVACCYWGKKPLSEFVTFASKFILVVDWGYWFEVGSMVLDHPPY